MPKPFLKWAGGKTQLLPEIDRIIGDFRSSSNGFIYVEPFVGGGSVLFHLLGTCSNLKYAVINDANYALMNCYRVIADNDAYVELVDRLIDIQKRYNRADSVEQKNQYLAYRKTFNELVQTQGVLNSELAALFIFLNKCCFNGLYRVNQKGLFNVPWGQKDYVSLFDCDNLDECHMLLHDKVVFMCGDYSDTHVFSQFRRVGYNDIIVYLDPPYKPISETASFTSYTKNSFCDKDQVKLRDYCTTLDQMGVKFLMSNSKVGNFFEELYSWCRIETVNAKRNINSVGSKRGDVEEILVYNK